MRCARGLLKQIGFEGSVREQVEIERMCRTMLCFTCVLGLWVLNGVRRWQVRLCPKGVLSGVPDSSNSCSK